MFCESLYIVLCCVVLCFCYYCVVVGFALLSLLSTHILRGFVGSHYVCVLVFTGISKRRAH